VPSSACFGGSILLGRKGSSATPTLPFIVAAAQIGMDAGVLTQANGAALIAAGLLSVIIFPALGLTLLRRADSAPAAADRRRRAPTPAVPVMTAEQVR
jgi:hypothetical protein